MKLTSENYLVLKRLINRTVPPLPYTPSLRAQGQYVCRVTLDCSTVANKILMAVIVKGQRYLGLKFLKYFNVKKMRKVKGSEIQIVKGKERGKNTTEQ